MAVWKKILVSGSGVSELNNNVGYAITGSNSFQGNQTINGNITLTGSLFASQSIISKVDYIDFTPNKYDTVTPGTVPNHTEARLFYDTGSQALCIYNGEADVALNIGQEEWLRARNQTGTTITNGSVVKINGAVGNMPSISLAQAQDRVQNFTTTNDIIGIATHDIETGTDGFVTTYGLVNGVNTSGFSAGDSLWISQSAGLYTNVAPSAPIDKIFIGVVTRVNANNGSIFVCPRGPIHFHDISSVSQSGNYTEGDIWMFRASGSTGVWTNTKVLSGSYILSGSLTTNDGVQIQSLTASFVSASSITSSLFGTASNAITASFLPIGTYNITSSWAQSASQALTASFLPAGTYNITSSWAADAASADNVRTPSVAALVTLGSTIKAEPLWGGFSNVTGASLGLTNQRLLLSPVFIHEPFIITGIKWIQVATGSYTPNNYNGVGLYSLSAGTLTNIASSSNAGTTWSTFGANSMGSASFGSTVTINAGLYYIGILWSRSAVTTIPTIGTAANTNTLTFDFTNSSKGFCFTDANTSMPSSVAMSAATPAAQTPYLVLF